MKTKTINTYSFDELSDESQSKALEKLRDINIHDSWWECIYDDAQNIGLKITSFDLDRHRHANGKLLYSANEVADLIKSNHGESCDTYKLACVFFDEYNDLVKKYSDGIETDKVHEDNEYDFDREVEELEEEFTKNLLEEYSIVLQKDYEDLWSDEAVSETIRANEYEFLEDGTIH
jgi:hypothetical protein